MEEVKNVKKALQRLGNFGKLFMDYEGCPRGMVGRAMLPIEEEVFLMPEIVDVDGGKWIPVNSEALKELVKKYQNLKQFENLENL